MYLTISDVETKEDLDRYQTDEWFDAIRYVEENKQTYLDKGCTRVRIRNKRAKTECFWDLSEKKRPLILDDQVHESCRKKK